MSVSVLCTKCDTVVRPDAVRRTPSYCPKCDEDLDPLGDVQRLQEELKTCKKEIEDLKEAAASSGRRRFIVPLFGNGAE